MTAVPKIVLLLIANRQAFDERRQPLESQWARAVCIYDWIAYGQRA